MSKGGVYLNISIIVRVIEICNELFCKLTGYFDGLVTRNKIFSNSIHRIDIHLDVVVEVHKVQSIFSFEFCSDEDFIEYW